MGAAHAEALGRVHMVQQGGIRQASMPATVGLCSAGWRRCTGPSEFRFLSKPDELPWRALSKKLMRPNLRYGSLFGCWVEKGLESSREVREEVAAGFEEENGGACLTLGPWD